ncbi:MAG: hypothetical protein ACLGI7_12060, partial [Gammaproteobacteria bacterium]
LTFASWPCLLHSEDFRGHFRSLTALALRMAPCRFAILSIPRAGSALLAERLNAHPQLACEGEIFHPRPQDQLSLRALNSVDLSLRESRPWRYIAAVLESAARDAHAAGFRYLADRHTIAERCILLDRSIRKVVLIRHNLLASFASHKQALLGGVWTLRRSAVDRVARREPPEAERVPFAAEEFHAYCRHAGDVYARYLGTVIATGQPLKVVNYWDVVSEQLAPLFRYLGVDADAPLRARSDALVKLGSADIASRFSNPGHVCECLIEYGRRDWLIEQAPDPALDGSAELDRLASGSAAQRRSAPAVEQ